MDFQLNRIVFKTVGVQHKTLKITSESKKTSSEAVAQRCSVKKVFLELLQNSQENNCARI